MYQAAVVVEDGPQSHAPWAATRPRHGMARQVTSVIIRARPTLMLNLALLLGVASFIVMFTLATFALAQH